MNSPLRDAYRHPALPRPRAGAEGGPSVAGPAVPAAFPRFYRKEWARRPVRLAGHVERPVHEGRASWAGVVLFACLGFSLFLLYLV